LHNWVKESTHGLAGKKTKGMNVSNGDIIITPKKVALSKS